MSKLFPLLCPGTLKIIFFNRLLIIKHYASRIYVLSTDVTWVTFRQITVYKKFKERKQSSCFSFSPFLMHHRNNTIVWLKIQRSGFAMRKRNLSCKSQVMWVTRLSAATATTKNWTTMFYQTDCIFANSIYNNTNRYGQNGTQIT